MICITTGFKERYFLLSYTKSRLKLHKHFLHFLSFATKYYQKSNTLNKLLNKTVKTHKNFKYSSIHMSNNKTRHLNTGTDVRIKRLVLVVIMIVPFKIFRFYDERKKTYLTKPPSLKSVTHILQWWNMAVIPYLKKIQKLYESRDTPLELCWHQHFLPEISKFCYIKKCRYRFHLDRQLLILLTFLESLRIVK